MRQCQPRLMSTLCCINVNSLSLENPGVPKRGAPHINGFLYKGWINGMIMVAFSNHCALALATFEWFKINKLIPLMNG